MIPTLCLLLFSAAPARPAAQRLATADTMLVLEAGAESPRVVSLTGSPGIVWKNQQAEYLIERVQMGGKWVPVRWRLQSVERSADGTAITAIYASATPRMRLLWRWQAHAPSGPSNIPSR
jgi:hypothetical protein